MKIREIELYIHIPFCVKKCNYCDFLSFSADEYLIKKYIMVLNNELACKARLCKNTIVTSIFIGGGTPSVVPSIMIDMIMNTIRKYFVLKDTIEITIEANPGTITKEKAIDYLGMGINRVSMGLQSADDLLLKKLGRIHTYKDFEESFYILRNAGFDNINIDIMSGLPGLTLENYKDTLTKVCEKNPEHISAYSLIIEEKTPFFELYNNQDGTKKEELPDEDDEREQYYYTDEFLKENEYNRYEISNYSRKGYECKHNIGYWKRKEYLGIGLGAASFYEKKRFINTSDLKEYIAKEGVDTYKDVILLEEKDEMEEFMYLGLRMMEGIQISEFNKQFSVNFDKVYGEIIKKFSRMGLIICENDRVYLTTKGIDVSNYIFSEFIQ